MDFKKNITYIPYNIHGIASNVQTLSWKKWEEKKKRNKKNEIPVSSSFQINYTNADREEKDILPLIEQKLELASSDIFLSLSHGN